MTNTTITIHLDKPLRAAELRMVGINVNFLTDHAAIRQKGQGFQEALRKMGVRSLRYPGGEKSDEFYWSTPPWDAPRPTLALTGPKGRLSPMTDYVDNFTTFRNPPMDFDEFIELCRALHAEPTICVNFDSMYLPPVSEKGTAPTKEQLLEHAVEWVRYANVKKGYNVRYWELGNESYLLGHNGAAKAEDYARDAAVFARVMKAVDPSILIGVNGHVHKDSRGKSDGDDGPIWWQTVLQDTADVIDFLVVHPYPCWMWGEYDTYIHSSPVFTEAAEEALAAAHAWAPAHYERLRVVVSETNAADWAGSEHFPGFKGWPLVNDLGHALVLFDIIGQHLQHPGVDMAQVWNTRWVHPAEKSLWNTLDENNSFNATAHALALWGNNLLDDMVETSSLETNLPSFASRDGNGGRVNVFLINKSYQARQVRVIAAGGRGDWHGTWSALVGDGPQDPSPSLDHFGEIGLCSGDFTLELPPVSIAVINLERAND
jgi:alpha-L-arabinofuranosidase